MTLEVKGIPVRTAVLGNLASLSSIN